MYYIFILYLLTAFTLYSKESSIEKGGMKVIWKIKGKEIEFTLNYPSKGWGAIGINKKKEFIGSKLVMGKIENGKAIFSERQIIGFGNHKSLTDLNERENIHILDFKENDKHTILKFKMPLKSTGDYGLNLTSREKLYFTIAYSLEKDFFHHSVFRTSFELRL